MRKAIVAANWKMNKTVGEAVSVASEIRRRLEGFEAVEVVICPPFTALGAVGDVLRSGSVRLGAQNVHWEAGGAFTGEVSAAMLRALRCDYVIVGHSERRTGFGETDDQVNRKARAALEAGLRPIVCIGETREQRDGGETERVLERQIEGSLAGLGEGLERTVIAYEPVWAIGAGTPATTDQVQQAHVFIRARIAEMAGQPTAGSIRIQYGGSVKPDNAPALFSLPDVDGALVGGTSLQADTFEPIVRAAGGPAR